MKNLWVVECCFWGGKNPVWDICDFTKFPYARTNFYKAHEFKRKIQQYLQKHGNRKWYKNRFRVSKYTKEVS